jgi:hypothetical protein
MRQSKKPALPMPMATSLLGDIRQLIDTARERAVAAVNSEMTLLYWRIGQRIQTQVLDGQRAEYGKEIVATLSQQLTGEYGRGFAEKNLRRMVQFAEVFPDEQIVVTLSRQLGWSHFVPLLTLAPCAPALTPCFTSVQHCPASRMN